MPSGILQYDEDHPMKILCFAAVPDPQSNGCEHVSHLSRDARPESPSVVHIPIGCLRPANWPSLPSCPPARGSLWLPTIRSNLADCVSKTIDSFVWCVGRFAMVGQPSHSTTESKPRRWCLTFFEKRKSMSIPLMFNDGISGVSFPVSPSAVRHRRSPRLRCGGGESLWWGMRRAQGACSGCLVPCCNPLGYTRPHTHTSKEGFGEEGNRSVYRLNLADPSRRSPL